MPKCLFYIYMVVVYRVTVVVPDAAVMAAALTVHSPRPVSIAQPPWPCSPCQ